MKLANNTGDISGIKRMVPILSKYLKSIHNKYYRTNKHLKFKFLKILKKTGSLEDKPSQKSTNR